MPQNRIIYNVQDLYVGPAKDEQAILLPQQHLLQRLYRIQSFNYDINLNRQEYKQLGSKGTLNYPIISAPDISFQFDYLLAGVSNESKVGLNVNWNLTGQQPIYNGSTGVCLISGFSDSNRDNDKRNFYLAINQSGLDGHSLSSASFTTGYSGWSLSDFVDPRSQSYHILSFVDSYLTNIVYNAEVGDFPRAQLNYVASNVVYYPSGSGIAVPKINPNNPTGIFSNYSAVLPRHYYDGLPAALKPGDITFSLTSTGYGSVISDWGLAIDDAKLQSYSVSINIPREKLQYIGNHFPIDRPILYPIIANLDLNFVVGDMVNYSSSTGLQTFEDRYLQSTDGSWYAFRLDTGYYINVDQTPSTPSAGSTNSWVLNCADDGLNYRVGLSTDNGITSITIDQESTGVAGDSYKSIWSEDNTLHAFSLVSGGFITAYIDPDPLSIPSAITSSRSVESLDSLIRKDYEYNASIKINNSLYNYQSGQSVAFLMNVKRAKIQSSSFSSNINQPRQASITLSTEINPDDLTKGVFISGILPSLSISPNASEDPTKLINTIIITNELITDNGLDLITADNGEVLAVDDINYTPSLF